MVKKYQRIGLRRENNLSDVLNRDVALGNILDNLASSGETFQPNDLYFSIKNLYTTDIRPIDLTDLANKVVIYFDENRIPRPVSPLITIKDQIDNYKLVTGDPPFLSGGDGLNAYFIQANEIQTATANSTGVDLYANTAVETGPFSFWTDGTFSLPNFVYEAFQEPDGLIKWEGFFSPDIDLTTNNFNVASTGLILIEVEINGVYETILSIYAADREIAYTAASTGPISTLNIGDQIKHVGIGDLVKEVNGVDVSDQNITISTLSLAGQTVTLSADIDVNSGANTILFGFDVGVNYITSYFSIDSLAIGQKIPIRIYNWWPTPVTGSTASRDTVFRYININQFLPYTYFYTAIPSPGEQLPDSIEYFFNSYLQPKKKRTNSEVLVTDQIAIDYVPPTLRTQKVLATGTISSQGGLEINVSGLFTNAEVGDYLYINNPNPTGDKIYQINRILTNSRAILEGNEDTIDNLTGASVTLIDHMGLVGIYDITAGLEISEISNTLFPLFDPNGYSLVRDDMLIANPTGTYFMRILDATKNTTTVTVTTGVVAGSETIGAGLVVVYRDKGLNDQSKLVFCDGVFAREVAAQATAGATQLQLTSVDGSELNNYVQFAGTIPSGTTVTSANTSTGVITLSQAITGTLVAGETVTISPDNVNREVCNIALNTAPPFEGTVRGLTTVNGNEGIDANEIAFDNLEMTIGSIATTSGTSYTQTLDVTHNGATYKLLIV